jgi:hypothetical protein
VLLEKIVVHEVSYVRKKILKRLTHMDILCIDQY